MENENKSTVPPAKRKAWRGRLVMGLIVAFGLYGFIEHMLHPQTQEQIQKQEQEYAEQMKAQADHQKFLDAMCHQEEICRRYAFARQECATAGDFNNCIKVKLGYQDAITVDSCTENGGLAYRPKDMPERTVCWIKEQFR